MRRPTPGWIATLSLIGFALAVLAGWRGLGRWAETMATGLPLLVALLALLMLSLLGFTAALRSRRAAQRAGGG